MIDPVDFHYYVTSKSTAENFIMEMLTLGNPIETSIVGVFDKEGRGSRRDIDLPLHRDGEYSAALAAQQGGYITPPADIDFVGLYCLRRGSEPCFTLIECDNRIETLELQPGEALIFNNKTVRHGRRGPVGERLLLRMWVKACQD